MSTSGDARPYRSHQQPACIPCRKRKSRCKLGLGAPSSCLMCEVHGSLCVFPNAAETNSPVRTSRAAARKAQARGGPSSPGRHASSQEVPFAHAGSAAAISPGQPDRNANAAASREDDEAHVVGPVQSPDALLIASYLSKDSASRTGRGAPHHSVHTPGERQVMFSSVRRHPLGRSSGQSTAAARLEVVEKLLEPHIDSLVDVYFDKVNKCYPVLDEHAFRRQYNTSKAKLSPALLSNLYAQSLVYWRQTLPPGHHCPDIRYIWNQANEALYWELYQSPGLSTIVAILLNISGRPLSSMIGNAVLLGAAISLAHCLGLNRNCMSWDISRAEKAHRIRVWWAIIIYDKWSSVAYGTPPRIQASQFDVPVPTLQHMAPRDGDGKEVDDSSSRDRTGTMYIAFTGLTEILDLFLGHVYNLDTAGSTTANLENRLARWADSLPHDLRRVIVRGVDVNAIGAANLRLSYLYLRLLILRLGLVDSERQGRDKGRRDPSCLMQRQLHTRQAAEDIVIFVQELEAPALAGFWFSFNAFAPSSTAAFLLTSALQQQQQEASGGDGGRRRNGSRDDAKNIYIDLAVDLITALDTHRKNAGWDLANICIAQYAGIIEDLQQHAAEAPFRTAPATPRAPTAADTVCVAPCHAADSSSDEVRVSGLGPGPEDTMPDRDDGDGIVPPAVLLQQQQYQLHPFQQQFPLPQQFGMPFDAPDGGMYVSDVFASTWDSMFDTV
ncbi:fungal-specific transcription factor domain-domain-containing protein [Microdochium bolleyi]|uniref:Fungal-specific transcription factor domain-domain-containing protein n=1 Tax=Microdochium bolleyi TaxID=196109 RepID=A0A136IY56_9PEZI|nr:fungal-specific transcription factor domain-domain-containing protein [Microdochium bolleyi]